ncbi:hypothetical protein ACFW9D_05775 [Streptomyces sp. NPDC059524]|uniref:hypothetical protein n=1 Tax=Streptomyces sp. NPDC059524 TaxID=3346856 RepID=UPI0036826CD1
MPSAEPIPGGPTEAPGVEDARIIPLAPRTGRRATHRSGGAGMIPDPEPEGDAAAVLAPLTEYLELAYLREHLSLTDPRVLAAFNVAIDAAVTITAGAQAQGIVDAEQQQKLAGLLEGAKQAARVAHGA